ncbi:MAG: hypothetical protein H6810_10630 [Phycisphaeraceae bacterium]|nr:MAG: hypothetical protein H6810_10630 [Phycisphaeraceae bacterium]
MNQRSSRVVAVLAGLAFTSSAFAQSDIFWNAGSGDWSVPTNWDPANTPDTAAENAHILGPAFINVKLDVSVSINELDVGPQLTLELNPGQHLNLAGDLMNSGFISINPSFSTQDSYIQFTSNALLSGSGGILRLSGGDNDAAIFTNGTNITNDVGHTIDGAGLIHASLINNGVVSAIPTGFANRLDLVTTNKVNNSTMQAALDAELFVSGIAITQGPSGAITANTGGQVTFNSNVTVTGGRLDGSGVFRRVGNGTLSLTNVVIHTSIPVEPGSQINYTGAAFDCTGDITLNDTDSGADAYIQFFSNCTATGGGRIFLAGGGAPGASNDSAVYTNGTVLTIGNLTVEGSGELHAALVNNGLIRAFPSSNGDGRLRLITNNKTNNTQILADAGGVVEINGITITQDPSAVLLADGGEIELNGNQTIVNGTLRTVNGGVIQRIGNGTLSLTNVVVDTTIPVEPGSQINYTGTTFNCTGDITLNDTNSGADAYIQFFSNCTATGGGRIFLAGGGAPGASNDSAVHTNGTVLTVAPDFVIEGSGELHAALVNNGLIRAFPSTNGDGRLRLITNNKTNNTQILADTGGVVEINGIALTQDPSAVLLADGGEIELNGNQTIVNGTLRTVNGGVVRRIGNGTLSLTNVVVDASIPVEPGSQINYTGAVFNGTGDITLNETDSGADAYIQFFSNCTATGGGRIFLAGGGAPGASNDSSVYTNGTVLTVAPDFVIEGSGELHAALVNNGLIRAFPSSNGDGRLRLITNNKTNNTQILADAGGVVEINGIAITQDPSAVLQADGGTIEFNGGATLNGGVLRATNGGAIVRLGNGTLNTADLTLEGEIDLQPGANIQYNSVFFENNGAILVNPTTSTADAYVQFNANTVVTGDGRIVLGGGGNDSVLYTNGTVPTFGPGQRLEGEGQMYGTWNVQGVIAPGLPIGEITGNANLNFANTTVIEADTDGPGSGDRLNIASGQVACDGVVRVGLSSYVPAVNDQFNLITATSVSGAFDGVTVVAGSLPTNIDVRLVYTPTSVDVKFVCIADLAPPFGLLDLDDVTGFVSAFLVQDPLADLAEPIGLFDLSDVLAFVSAFLDGCN